MNRPCNKTCACAGTEMKKERKSLTGFFYLLFFLSGVSGLVYQTLWLRMFTLVLGNSLHSASIVFSSFMAGLAVGAWFFGRIIRSKKDILGVYVLLELGIASSAIAVSKAIPHISSVAAYLTRLLSPAPFFLDLFRLSVSFLILLPPTVLIGGTLPVLMHFLTCRLDVAGKRIGALYGWNTIGAVFGCALTGFWLIRTAGVSASLYLAGTLNFFVGSAAAVLRAFYRKLPEKPVPTSRAADQSAATPKSTELRRLLLATAGITGGVSLAYEVVWARFLSYIMYNDIYAYYLMLSIMLGGIGLGSLIYSRWLDRLKDRLRRLAFFEIALGLIAVSCYLACAIHYRWPGSSLWIKNMQNFFTAHFADPFYSNMTIKLLYGLAVMLLPTVIMGIVFPLICRLYLADEKNIGGETGLVYAVNTSGAIIGSLACGFLIVPRLGVQVSLFLMAALNIALGAAILFYGSSKRGRIPIRDSAWITTAVVIFCLLTFLPSNQIREFALKDKKHTELVFYREGLSGTVAVVRDRINGTKTLYINAIAEVHNSYAGMLTFKLMGHLPCLLHKGEPQEVLMVTFGGGIASGAVATHPIKRLDVVELEPAVINASQAYVEENRDILRDPRLKIHVGDGRNFLFSTDKRYDLIISDATNPGSSDSWLLYTLEFYSLCRDRLAPGGIMTQWLPLHSGIMESYCTIVKTFQAVFPHTSIWFVKDYTLLVGLPEPLYISYPELAARLAAPGIREDLEQYCLAGSLELFDCFLMGEESVRKMTREARISTDNLPFYQLMYTEQAEPRAILAMLDKYRNRGFQFLNGLEEDQAQALKDSLETYYGSQGFLLRKDFSGALRQNPASCKVKKFYQWYQDEVAYIAAVADCDPENYYLQLRAAVSLAAHREYRKAREFFLRLVSLDPGDVSNFVNVGNIDFELGDYESSVSYYRKALEMGRKSADIAGRFGQALLLTGKKEEALGYLYQAVEMNQDNEAALVNLGYCYSQLGKSDQARGFFERAIKINPVNLAANINLGMIYLGEENTAQAEPLFRRAVEIAPGNYSAWMGLGITLFRTARYIEAREAFQKAVAARPGDRVAGEYLEKLETILKGK